MSKPIEICTQCGYSHLPKNRRRNIKRMVNQEIDTREIKIAWPYFYPHERKNDASDRRLWRDIAAVKERARAYGPQESAD